MSEDDYDDFRYSVVGLLFALAVIFVPYQEVVDQNRVLARSLRVERFRADLAEKRMIWHEVETGNIEDQVHEDLVMAGKDLLRAVEQCEGEVDQARCRQCVFDLETCNMELADQKEACPIGQP